MKRMIGLVKKMWDVTITADDLKAVEYNIIKTLDWSLTNVSPLDFVARYLRLLELG